MLAGTQGPARGGCRRAQSEARAHWSSACSRHRVASQALSSFSSSAEEREAVVPTISTFMGITITMYFDDHAPPHFHAREGVTLQAIEPLQ